MATLRYGICVGILLVCVSVGGTVHAQQQATAGAPPVIETMPGTYTAQQGSSCSQMYGRYYNCGGQAYYWNGKALVSVWSVVSKPNKADPYRFFADWFALY